MSMKVHLFRFMCMLKKWQETPFRQLLHSRMGLTAYVPMSSGHSSYHHLCLPRSSCFPPKPTLTPATFDELTTFFLIGYCRFTVNMACHHIRWASGWRDMALWCWIEWDYSGGLKPCWHCVWAGEAMNGSTCSYPGCPFGLQLKIGCFLLPLL
jgi:hypothetical protein